MNFLTFILALLAFTAGATGSYLYQKPKTEEKIAESKRKIKEAELEAEKILTQVEHKKDHAITQAKEIVLEGKNEAMKIKESAEKIRDEAKGEDRKLREQFAIQETRLLKREETLEKKIEDNELIKKELENRVNEVKAIKKSAEELKNQEIERLAEVAKLSQEEAKKILLEKVDTDISEMVASRVQKAEEDIKEQSERQAQQVIVSAIQRIASEVTSESTVTIVDLPSDEMKGRIIGREGRNINAFEQITGVDVIVDDTPNSILISGFDLLRRYIAKTALEQLVKDGRIHPARIEELVEKTRKDVDLQIKDAGEKAAFEVGVTGMPPNLIKLLGRLKFRTSYGQNVLRHSVEVAFLAAGMAAQIGADEKVASIAGLFHDIGKAVDHEIEGSHAVIGANILRKFKLPEIIINSVESHHEDVSPDSTIAFLVQAADAISGSRPGARRESLDAYLKRLEDLENVATSFEGVEKAYAIQAGREVRIVVKPEEIDDASATRLAYDIARKIEKDLTYPGQIKVNVMREIRVTEFAK